MDTSAGRQPAHAAHNTIDYLKKENADFIKPVAPIQPWS